MVNPSTNRVAVVILNWNGEDDTILCVESLNDQIYKDFEIILIDNGSRPESVAKIETFLNEVSMPLTFIKNSKNRGFAGGVNTGIRKAQDMGFDMVALLNNDATADRRWLAMLVDEMVNDEVGIVTSTLLRSNGKKIDSTGELYSNWGLSFQRLRDEPASEVPKKGDYIFGATGGATLYRTSLFEKIGLFDESFFAYYEDVDVSFRAQLAGWRIYYTPKAIVYHKQGATSKKIPGFTIYQTIKNLPLVFLKNIPRGLLIPVGARFYLAYWLIIGNAIIKGDGGPVLKGVLASFFLGFPALVKRHNIQKHKRVSTAYIKRIMWNDLPPEQTGMRKFRKFFTGKP